MTERRIAQRFVVLASLEDTKLGTLHAVNDEVLGAPALLLLPASAADTSDAVLDAIVADNRRLVGCPDVLFTYAAGRSEEGTWLATEGAPGMLLGEMMARKDRLELPQLIRLGLALGRALTAMADAQVQHLDLGPHRVWVQGDSLAQGAIRCFGMGWWRLLPAYQGGASADAFYGTPEFLAAELCKGQPATPTSDLYSAALVLWALAASKPPFTSSQPLMTLKRQAVEKPLRLDLVKPALKGVKDLQALIADALDKDPGKRPTPQAWLALAQAAAQQWAPAVATESVGVPEARQEAAAVPAAAAAAASAPAPAPAPAPAAAPAPAPAAVEAPAAEAQATPDDLPNAAPPATSWRSEAGDRSDIMSTMKISSEMMNEALARMGGTSEADLPVLQAPTAAEPAQAAPAPHEAASVAAASAEEESESEAEAAEPVSAGASAPGDFGRKGKKGRKGGRERSTLMAGEGGAAQAKAGAQPAVAPAVVAAEEESPAQKTQIYNLAAVTAAGAKLAAESAKPGASSSGNSPGRPMTARTMRVEIAESNFFSEDPSLPAEELHEQMPPTPPKAKVGKGVILAIGAFVAAMAAWAIWTVSNSAGEKPAATAEPVAEPQPAPAAEEPAPAAEPAPAQAAAPAAPAEPAPAAVPAPAADALPPAGDAAAPAGAAAPVPAAAAVDGEAQRAATVAQLVDQGNAALAADPKAALEKATAALALNAGNAPAARLQAEAQRALDQQAAQKAAADKAAADKEAADKAAAQKAQAAADKEAAAKEAAAKAKAAADAAAEAKSQAAARSQAAAQAAARESAVEKKAAVKADKAAAAKAKAAAEKADKAEKERAAKEAAQKAAAQKAAAAKAAKDKAAADKSAARPVADKVAKAEKAAADKAAERPAAKAEAPAKVEAPAPRPPPAGGDEGTPAQQEASKMAALAQKANKAKLKVLYLQKAVKLDPSNGTYKSLLKAAEAELAAEAQ